MPNYQWRTEHRIVAQDKDVVVIEEIYPVDGPTAATRTIEEAPFVVVFTRFENRGWNSTDEKPCKP